MPEHGGIIEPGSFPLMGEEGSPEAIYVPQDMHITIRDARLPKTLEELKVLIQDEVRKALDEQMRTLRVNTGLRGSDGRNQL